MLDLFMKTKHPALVHDEENNKASHQNDHTYGSKEQYCWDRGFGGLQKEHNGFGSLLFYIMSK